MQDVCLQKPHGKSMWLCSRRSQVIVQRSNCYCPALAKPVSSYVCFTTAAQLGRVGELGPSRQPGIRSLRFVFSSNIRTGVALVGNCPLLPTRLHVSVSLCSHTHTPRYLLMLSEFWLL